MDNSNQKPSGITFSEMALLEIFLLLENDFSDKKRGFRISVGGKGCDGFSYTAGLSEIDPKDTKIEFMAKGKRFFLLLDPFISFYFKNATIDFYQDPTKDIEGFIINNLDQKKFAGKFWKQAPELAPQF